jgi:hypothetical protein
VRYDESVLRKRALEKELLDLEAKLQRAQQLLTGLAGEQASWQATIVQLESAIECLPGDVAVAALFLSYAGPFNSTLREELAKDSWHKKVSSPICRPQSSPMPERDIVHNVCSNLHPCAVSQPCYQKRTTCNARESLLA